MGMLSVVLVKHDHLHQIGEDRELGEKVKDAILKFGHSRQAFVANGVELIASSINASDCCTIVVEQNTAHKVEDSIYREGTLPDWSNAESRLVEIVRQLGYKVVKPRKRK